MARSSSLAMPGFPDFEKVVSELKSSATETATPDFEVCVPVPNGLAIKQSLVEYWSSMDMFSTDMASLLEQHNKKYNTHGIKRGHAEVENSNGDNKVEVSSKKLRVDQSVKLAEHEATIADKCVLVCGSFKLVYDVQQEVLWVAASDGKKRSETFEMRGPAELFGFGSGDFCEGPTAKDVQSDLTGRWVSFNMSSANDLCILEADKRLPEHIRKMDLFGKAPLAFFFMLRLPLSIVSVDIGSGLKTQLILSCPPLADSLMANGSFLSFVLICEVITLATAINELENAGEVKVKLSMHTMEKLEGNSFKVVVNKDVCFVRDPPKDSKRKKAGEPRTE
eukprot:Skav217456  [mRNA]  locus=scaffold1289:122745:123968:- [translate_table: standard]